MITTSLQSLNVSASVGPGIDIAIMYLIEVSSWGLCGMP